MKKALFFLRSGFQREITYFRQCCGECWYYDESQGYCENLVVYKSPDAPACKDFC